MERAVATPVGEASPGPAGRLFPLLVRGLLGLFFRRIEVAGGEHLPADRGGILVAWHPNGLLDPALILGECPRPVVFGARDGLFRWPLLGAVLRRVGTVPIFRPQDASGMDDAARREANRRSLERLAEAVAAGRFAALFPEGVSHDEPGLQVLRPGAARLYLRSVELASRGGGRLPVVVPVGLHYDRKHLFGSSVLVEFHAPLGVPEELLRPPSTDSEPREAERRLTARLEAELTEIVQTTDTWETHFLIHRLRKLVRAERASRAAAAPGPATVRERVLGFSRIRLAHAERLRTHPGETAALRARVEAYDAALRSLGLEDHDLDGEDRRASVLRAVGLAVQAVVVYLLLPPLLVLGYVVNVPVAMGLGELARRTGREKKDEATLKLLLGAVAFPAVWLGLALLVAWGQINLHDAYPAIARAPWAAGIVTFLLCSVGGWIGLRYLRSAGELYRALRVRLTRARRRRAVARLLVLRSHLFEEAMRLAEGLELPGVVTAEGKIDPEPGPTG